jgi:hypothetical protein
MLNRKASRPPHTNPANTVVLAGAGISLDWPSCFPIGSSIVSALAAWLGDGDAGQTARAKAALSLRGANPYSFIRFEQMWETLELLVPGISSTMESLELFGAPNADHHVIADFLDHGGTLVTTNFDRRIEQALRERGSSLRPWVFGARPRAPRADTRFFKIHGSFGYRRKLLSSLFAIGSAGLVFSRYPSLRRALLERVAGRRLVVAGYSFSDHFDVVPLIERDFAPSEVIWIRYDGSALEPKFIPFEDVDDLPIPDPSVSFEHAALARFRHRSPDIPVWEVRHPRVADVLTDLGLASPSRLGADQAEVDAAELNRAAFADELDPVETDLKWKQFVIQMLERRDGFGFHASLDTSIDNEWTDLVPPDGLVRHASARKEDACPDIFQTVADLTRRGDIAAAEELIKRTSLLENAGDSRDLLLARALLARRKADIRGAYQLQLEYMTQQTAPSAPGRYQYSLEETDVGAALALDYFDAALSSKDFSFARTLIAQLEYLFRNTGMIWIAIERELAIARLGQATLRVAAQHGFNSARESAERAAYFCWRSGRWDLAWSAVNLLTWYWALRGEPEKSVRALRRIRAICPDADGNAWLTMTSNIALNLALYGDPREAEKELSILEERSTRHEDGPLFLLIGRAAQQCATGDIEAGRRTMEEARRLICEQGKENSDHTSCLDAIAARFGLNAAR